jgi:thioredoxin reductase (NADPH)
MRIEFFPAIIIGGGVAGTSCAVEMCYNAVEHLLLHDQAEPGGQLDLIKTKIRNLGGLYFSDGPSLKKKLTRYARATGIKLCTSASVQKCDLVERSLQTENASYRFDALVIATGARLRLLDCECDAGLREKIIYFTERREKEFVEKAVIVNGGGDYAVSTAVTLARKGAKVTLLYRRSQFGARPDIVESARRETNVRIMTNTKIAAVRGTGKIELVELEDTTDGKRVELPTDAVVVKQGCAPNSELFSGQLPLTDGGYITVDANLETAVAGVFAVGDVTAFRYLRLATALGQGSAAAHSVMRFLCGDTINRKL